MAEKRKLTDEEIEQDAKVLQGYLDKLMPAFVQQEATIIAHSHALAQEYYLRRDRLHKELVKPYDDQGKKRPPHTYTPLGMISRHHDKQNSLQLSWANRRAKRSDVPQQATPRFKHLSKDAKEGYDLKVLKAHGRFAGEIVVEFELRARIIRAQWRDLQNLKRQARAIIQRFPPAVHEAAAPGTQPVDLIPARSQDG